MLESHWHVGARAARVGRRPVKITLFGRPLVLFRDGDGRIHCLEDRCAHRNVPLSCGRVVEGSLACPYHGWRYAGSGEVVHVPAAPGGICPGRRLSVPSYRCVEQDGHVWVCLAAEPARAAPPRFPGVDRPGWKTLYLYTRLTGTVEACLENLLDCPHTAYVHRGLFRSPQAAAMEARVRQTEDGAEVEYLAEPRGTSLAWRVLGPKAAQVRHIDRYIAPSMVVVEYEYSPEHHYYLSSACSPLNARETAMFTVISFRHGRLSALLKPLLWPLARQILHQDAAVLRDQQENIERFGGERFQVIPQDLLLPHVRRWRRLLEAGSRPSGGTAEQHEQIHV